jgi:hypothetical protein
MEQAVSRHDVPAALGQLAELVPEWQRSDLAKPITTVC